MYYDSKNIVMILDSFRIYGFIGLYCHTKEYILQKMLLQRVFRYIEQSVKKILTDSKRTIAGFGYENFFFNKVHKSSAE